MTEQPSQPEASRPSTSTATRNTGERRPQSRPQGRRFVRRRKFCKFCADTKLAIDYKDPDLLCSFITDRYKILPSRVTGTCAKHQRALTSAVKRARVLALLAFTPLHHD